MCPNSYVSFHDLDTKTGLYMSPTLSSFLAQGLGAREQGVEPPRSRRTDGARYLFKHPV